MVQLCPVEAVTVILVSGRLVPETVGVVPEMTALLVGLSMISGNSGTLNSCVIEDVLPSLSAALTIAV